MSAFDVIVVGGGGSGLAAAIEARAAGARVLLLEKNAAPGGSTAWSVGSVTATGTPHQLRKGIAEIPGIGAIPSEAAAWLLADGAPLRRLVIDQTTGQLLDFGTTTYLVPPHLAELLVARQVVSASPHSTVPAGGCDMEHNVPHLSGGPTNPLNVTPVERRWHRAKTHGGWHYEKDPETGIVTWRSPTGLTCVIEPYDYRSGF